MSPIVSRSIRVVDMILFDRDGDTGRSLRNGKDTDSGFVAPTPVHDRRGLPPRVLYTMEHRNAHDSAYSPVFHQHPDIVE